MYSLIERHGAPRLVIENSRRILSTTRKGHWLLNRERARDLDVRRDFYYREAVTGGDADYLLIERRLELGLEELGRFQRRLERLGEHIVEFVREGRVALVALESDVMPVTRGDLQHAADNHRLVAVSSWRSMGDGYVDFHFPTAEWLVDDRASLFLFNDAIHADELPPSGEIGSYDSIDDVWRWIRRHFVREPLDAEAGWPIAVPTELSARLGADGPLPLHASSRAEWALRADGAVLRTESGAPDEIVTERATIWGALAQGHKRWPELDDVLPLRPKGVERCRKCKGRGLTPEGDCATCGGLGWRATRPRGR